MKSHAELEKPVFPSGDGLFCFFPLATVRRCPHGLDEDERQPVEQPEAFLMRTALNLSIDAHRMSVGRGEHFLLEDTVLIDTTPSTEAVVLARERMARLALGVGRLSERTRDIFVANRVDGLPHAEIAKRYGISVTTVHQHLAKATLRLTEWMEGW